MLSNLFVAFLVFNFNPALALDLEINNELAAKFVKDFIDSEDPYADAARQIHESSDAAVQHTTALFGNNCNLAWNVELKQELNFTSPNYGNSDVTYPTNFSCHLSFTGSEKCIPVMSCDGKIDLRSSVGSLCENEYLSVSDGIGGEQKFCGGMAFLPLRATGSGRDLYVKIQTSPKPLNQKKKGFRCTVKCHGPDTEKAKQLKTVPNELKTVQQCVCGYQNTVNRVVGGDDARENEFPWIASLVQKGTRSPFCGGSLINDRWILTAAHCFFNTNYTTQDIDVLLHADLLDMLYLENANIEAILGQKGSIQGPGFNNSEKTDRDEYTQRYEIERIVLHPLYSKKYDFDVSLVEITPPIKLSTLNAPTPICLPRVGNYGEKYKGYNVTVAGWGKAHEKAGASTRKLQKLEEIPVLDFEECRAMLKKFELTDRMLCAGFLEGGRDACTGDSGGPLMHKEGRSRYRQVGVVSFGSGCARRNSPGLYAKLTDLGQWIIYHTNQVKPYWCRDTLTID